LWALFVVFVQWVNGNFDGAALSYVVVVAGFGLAGAAIFTGLLRIIRSLWRKVAAR
jgi:hypothetical protein